jgi:hypothetical protein
MRTASSFSQIERSDDKLIGRDATRGVWVWSVMVGMTWN